MTKKDKSEKRDVLSKCVGEHLHRYPMVSGEPLPVLTNKTINIFISSANLEVAAMLCMIRKAIL